MHLIDICAESSKKKSAKRLIILTICIFLIAGSIFSVFSIFKHMSHNHDRIGSDINCAACTHITAVENLLKSLSSVIAGVMLAFGCLSVIISFLKVIVFHTGLSTLLCQRIRFNN